MSLPFLSAIVLAAGSSRRMGKANKLLLPWQQKAVVTTVVDHLLAVTGIEVIVVMGHEAELIQTALGERSLKKVVNPEHLKGMTTSIQCGLRATDVASQGYMICLADLPLIGSGIYQNIVQSFQAVVPSNPKTILVPRFQKKRGHPIVFSQYYKTQLLQHPILEGCKQILQDHQKHLHFFPCKDPAILLDMDTPEAYQKLKQSRN
ncbi:MAG: nucleotidyltransferase family protein [Bacteroidota bacterium]